MPDTAMEVLINVLVEDHGDPMRAAVDALEHARRTPRLDVAQVRTVLVETGAPLTDWVYVRDIEPRDA